MGPAIETDGLTKRFGDVVAVDGLDMTVERGESYGFLGPNGAGKSTTIDLLVGFLEPTTGTATVLGHDIREGSREIRRRIGVLPEGTDLYPRSTGREHIAFVGRVRDVDVDPEAVLDRLGLDRADQRRYVREYSKGMRQRLSLGMALAGEPDLLILDEPGTGLDPTGQAEIRDIVREEVDDGTTVFLSSHQLSSVESVCDRVGILDSGHLVAEDTIEGLRDLPGVGFTVSLGFAEPIGDLGLNDLEGVTAVTRGNGLARTRRDGDADRWLDVTCRAPGDRIDAIRRADERGRLVDVETREPSLETLFERYVDDDSVHESVGKRREVQA
ncbi:ABC transporter ATP-binding protein [Halovivax gelatinilyticus]|uniref:ABC transporter ATP-binding protein n=1 Tax=Halovivax gelatinilyticus TaxID=2961597 RepID=UPI0020CA4581|nr:ABC transporter ATP-binding protein [Halovivax gelatinilyticus]